MRNTLLSILAILILELCFQSCANRATISGGPKDSIPPVLINSIPPDQSLNFDGQTFTLTFDEQVTAEKIRQSLIITPFTENDYKHSAKKQTVTLYFDEPFDDSTTYTLNFFDGVTDITEKNPAENLILAFSTGSYIDSLEIFGNVKNIANGNPEEKVTVGLYRITDSLDIFINKPTYFYNTNKSGAFHIQNIKQDKYRLIAFKDENRNLIFNGDEVHAFLSDTLFLQESIQDSILLRTIELDASPLKLISARPTTRYFEARFSKKITSYSIAQPDNVKPIASQLLAENENVRFYNNINLSESDSTSVIIEALDTLNNKTVDTVYVQFRESNRRLEELTSTISPPSSKPISINQTFSIQFNKPISIIDSSFAYIRLDTLYQIDLNLENIQLGNHNTNLSFTLPQLSKQYYEDTLTAIQNELVQDTSNIDSIDQVKYDLLSRLPRNRFQIAISSKSFLSVENDTSKAINSSYSFSSPENFGTIKLSLNTSYKKYTVQLMKQENAVQSVKDCKTCNFQKVEPGKYWIRILIDKNEDGQWSVGNIIDGIEPEPTIYFRNETTIRANWENELSFSF